MTLDDKIMKLDSILINSKLVTLVREHNDDETVEDVLIELKRDLIKLLETK